MWLTDTRIYRRSLLLVDVVRQVNADLPRGHGFLADQLRRASSSVTLNFSEGYTRKSSRERRRYFEIARGSALEVLAALDVGYTLGVVSSELHADGVDHADALAGMLGRFR